MRISCPPAAWEPVGRVTFLRNGIPQSDFSGNGQPVHPKPIVFPRFHCDLGQICCTPRNPRRRRAERGARSAPRAAPVQRSEFGLAWGESAGSASHGGAKRRLPLLIFPKVSEISGLPESRVTAARSAAWSATSARRLLLSDLGGTQIRRVSSQVAGWAYQQVGPPAPHTDVNKSK